LVLYYFYIYYLSFILFYLRPKPNHCHWMCRAWKGCGRAHRLSSRMVQQNDMAGPPFAHGTTTPA
jgi:hypothetical protein